MHSVAMKQNCCGIPLCNAGSSTVGAGEGERMREVMQCLDTGIRRQWLLANTAAPHALG